MMRKWNEADMPTDGPNLPQESGEDEPLLRLARLYRENAPAEPTPDAWNAALERIARQAIVPPAARRMRWRLFAGLAAAAAATVGGMLLARTLWPTSSSDPVDPSRMVRPAPLRPGKVRPVDEDEVYPVASAREVNIISIDVRDADRVAMGRPLLGVFELAAPEDIEVVEVEPDPEEGRRPRLQRGPALPMIVVVRADDDEP